MQSSFRDHVNQLEERGLLYRVKKSVNPEFEAAAIIKKASGAGKSVFFERISGKEPPVASNVAGSPEMISCGLSLNRDKFLPELSERLLRPQKTKLISQGPVQEVVEEPSALSRIPVLKYFERDASQYITAGIVIARDPDSGYRNCSFNRMMVRSDGKLGIRMMPPQHLGMIEEKTEKKDKNLEVAVVIGNHPAEMIAGASPLPFGVDHLDHASTLRGEPLEVVKSPSTDLEVPAHAEMVLEGEIQAKVRELEGPFGEFMDYYVEPGKNHVLELKSITHRSDYIYQALLCGSKEDLTILAIARELLIFKALCDQGYDVVDVSVMPFIFNGIISLRKKSDEEPKKAMKSAFDAYSWLKYCVVVDEDVDARTLDDAWWAMATRSQADKALLTIPGAPGFPRRDKWQLHVGKIGLDATVPLDRREEFRRKKIPGEDKINLQDYVSR